MKTKHTPGEWMILISEDEPCTKIIAETDGGHYVIAESYSIGNECDLTQAEANARLIAAAPELLETLRTAYAYLRAGNESLEIKIHNLLEKVINTREH